MRWLAALVLLLAIFSNVAVGAVYSARLGLLAVEPGDMEGLVIYARVELGPGSGGLVVEPGGLVDELLYVSTLIGFRVAALLSGVPPDWFNASVVIETSQQVGGPSASGFISATFYDFLHGFTPRGDEVTMTGMVSLTGLVLNVAGVEQKLHAAASRGFQVILVPAAEAKPVEGVEVLPVCDVADAASLVAGVEAPAVPGAPVPVGAELPAAGRFREAALRFMGYAARLLPLLPGREAESLNSTLEAARMLLEESPYAAASLAFSTLYDAARLVSTLHNFTAVEQALGITLEDAMSEARAAVDDARAAVLGDGGSCDLWRLAALAAAAYRLHMAEVAAGSDEPLALLRALSATLWARTVEGLRGPLVSCASAEAAARFMVDYAETGLQYLRLLAQSRLIPAVANTTLGDWVRDARSALEAGDWVTALGLSVYVVSQVESVLAHSTTTSCVLEHSRRLLSLAGGYALFPAAHFIDYAEAYLRANLTSVAPPDAMVAFMGATASSWSLVVLAAEAYSKPAPAAAASAPPASPPVGGGAGLPAEAGYAIAIAAASLAALASAAAARAAARREVV